jgi:hypothetical protein
MLRRTLASARTTAVGRDHGGKHQERGRSGADANGAERLRAAPGRPVAPRGSEPRSCSCASSPRRCRCRSAKTSGGRGPDRVRQRVERQGSGGVDATGSRRAAPPRRRGGRRERGRPASAFPASRMPCTTYVPSSAAAWRAARRKRRPSALALNRMSDEVARSATLQGGRGVARHLAPPVTCREEGDRLWHSGRVRPGPPRRLTGRGRDVPRLAARP